MPSSYSTNLTVELQAPTEKINVWGADQNNNVLVPLDTAIAGVLTKVITGDTTLTSGNGSASNEWRNPIWNFTGSLGASANITAPQRTGARIVRNATGQNLVLKTAISASTVTVPTGTTVKVWFDGTDCFRILDTNYGGSELRNIGTPTATTSAATKAYVDGLAFSTALPAGSAAGQVIRYNGTAAEWGAVDLADSDARTGILPVANGGTGETSLVNARNAILPSRTGQANRLLRVTADETGWETALSVAPALIKLAAATASASATVDFTSFIDSTYNEYEIHIINALSATDNVAFWLRTSSNAGSSWDSGASDYGYASQLLRNSGAASAFSSTGAAQCILGGGYNIQTDANCTGWSGVVRIFRPSASAFCRFMWQGVIPNAALTDEGLVFGMGVRAAASAVNGFRFLMSSGNIASGDFVLYGVQK